MLSRPAHRCAIEIDRARVDVVKFHGIEQVIRRRVGENARRLYVVERGSLDVVVHASREPEPFGLVIAEAMACGRAVITTANGGAAEWKRLSAMGADGFLVKPVHAKDVVTLVRRSLDERRSKPRPIG